MTLNKKAKLACGFAAFVSFIFSVWLWFLGLRLEAIFVGIWVPSILSSGCLIIPLKRDQNE